VVVTSRLHFARATIMMPNPLERVGPESYPTFWDEVPRTPIETEVLPEDAYAAFVNQVEDDCGADAFPDDE